MDRNVSIVINARTQSTRIPNKLLRSFAGTNLLTIALNKLSHTVSVPTYLAAADQEIIDLYKKYKYSRIKLLKRRPEAVEKGLNDYKIAWEHYGWIDTPYILCMNPCLPFTKMSTYLKAIEYFKNNTELKTMTSVKSSQNIFFNSDLQLINQLENTAIRTQDNKKVYEMAHVFHIFDKKFYLNNGYFWDYDKNDPYLYEVPKEETIDVDDPLDFIIAEKLYMEFKGDLSNAAK